MPESRAYTQEEVRDQVLAYAWNLIDYWLDHTRRPSERERMEGLAFTIFSMLDGSGSLPGFTVSPAPHPSDKAYHEAQGSNYYEPCDIAGSLHELFYGRRPDQATSHEAQLAAEIKRLRKVEQAARVLYNNMKGTCDYAAKEGDPPCQAPSFAGFMHAMCDAHAEELEAPVGALKDQTMLNNLKEALGA